MLEEAKKHYTLCNQLVTEMIACAPSNWTKGALTIERDNQLIACTLQNGNELGPISDELRSLCQQFAVSKPSPDTDISWLKATINYFLDDGISNFSAHIDYEYPQEIWTDVASEPMPDESWWRTQTQNLNWQQSPSLLVVEFIMDYRLWNDAAVRRSKSQDASEETRQFIQADWQHLIDKFCSPGFESQFMTYDAVSRHNVEREAVFSAETVGNQALVKTRLHDETTPDYLSDADYEYELQWTNGRWFLEQIYSLDNVGRTPQL